MIAQDAVALALGRAFIENATLRETVERLQREIEELRKAQPGPAAPKQERSRSSARRPVA